VIQRGYSKKKETKKKNYAVVFDKTGEKKSDTDNYNQQKKERKKEIFLK